MLRQSVDSTDLKEVGYDGSIQTLEIEFNSGGVYDYFDVPQNEYLSLMNASSHGKYFAQNIKSRYKFSKIS